MQAIVVLGGGMQRSSPEYGSPQLSANSLQRVRYGAWLGRQSGLPLAFSGGVGHGADPGPSEAEIAARIAEREFGRPLKWTETQSRDTNENAMRTLPMLKEQGIERVVLVTHGNHMRRAAAAFERASERLSVPMQITPAPMGGEGAHRLDLGDWLPSRSGYEAVCIALHEWLGRIAGA